MTVYKSTKHILTNPFEKIPSNIDSSYGYPTVHVDWDYQKEISIYDVEIWQQIFYESGVVGIYAAHVPQIEFYFITYNIFIDKEKGIETFYGPGASEATISRAKSLGIELPFTTRYVKN